MTTPAKRKRKPGGGRKNKGYEALRQCWVPKGTLDAIKAAKQPKETIGETIARKFGWTPEKGSKNKPKETK